MFCFTKESQRLWGFTAVMEDGCISRSDYCETDWQEPLKWSQCLVSKSASVLTPWKEWALSPPTVLLPQLWALSPRVTWGVRSSAERSMWKAAARRKFTLGPVVSVVFCWIVVLLFFFHFPDHPKWSFGFGQVDVTPLTSGKYFPSKVGGGGVRVRMFLHSSAHGCEKLRLRQ